MTLDDIYLGNGASELIVMATNALLDDGDELLRAGARLPAVDGGGQPVGRHAACTTCCDEANGWMPDLDDIRAKITPRTKGIVVINPNNPTGALYSDELLQGIIAHRPRARPGRCWPTRSTTRCCTTASSTPRMASLSEDVLTLTFNSPVQGLPLLRLPRRLDGGLGRQAAAPRTTSRA